MIIVFDTDKIVQPLVKAEKAVRDSYIKLSDKVYNGVDFISRIRLTVKPKD